MKKKKEYQTLMNRIIIPIIFLILIVLIQFIIIHQWIRYKESISWEKADIIHLVITEEEYYTPSITGKESSQSRYFYTVTDSFNGQTGEVEYILNYRSSDPVDLRINPRNGKIYIRKRLSVWDYFPFLMLESLLAILFLFCIQKIFKKDNDDK